MIFFKDTKTALNKAVRLEIITAISLALFLLNFAWHTLRLSTPIALPMLFDPADRFNDFFTVVEKMQDPYGPFLRRIIWLFSLLPPLAGRWTFLLLFGGGMAWLFYKSISLKNAVADTRNLLLLLFSYPVLYMLDRGNFELLVFLCLCGFAMSWQRGQRAASAFFLAAAIAMKPFPVIFLGFFVAEGEYLLAASAAGGALILLARAYATYPGALAAQVVAHHAGLISYDADFVFGDMGIAQGHSLFSLLKLLLFTPNEYAGRTQIFLPVELCYFAAASACGLALVWWHAKKKTLLALWEKMALYVCAMNLLPFVSKDYKLIYLLLPLLLFVNAGEENNLTTLYAVLFGLLISFKCLWHSATLAYMNEGVFLNPLLMTALSALIIYSKRTRAQKN